MITGLDHAAIVTRRLAETTAFFVDAIGLEVGYRPQVGIPGAWLYGGGRPLIHLIEDDAERPAAGVIDHVSLAATDLREALDRLDRAGVEYRTLEFPDGLGGQAFCRDPNGVTVEITCRTPAQAGPGSAAAK